MANQRASGQTLIGCHIDDEFLRAIDQARGGKSRSDFLREALYGYLKSIGITLNESVKYAPDRTGKGGRPKKAVQPTITAVPGTGTVKKPAARKEAG